MTLILAGPVHSILHPRRGWELRLISGFRMRQWIPPLQRCFPPLQSVSHPWVITFNARALNHNIIELSQPQSFKLDMVMPNLIPPRCQPELTEESQTSDSLGLCLKRNGEEAGCPLFTSLDLIFSGFRWR